MRAGCQAFQERHVPRCACAASYWIRHDCRRTRRPPRAHPDTQSVRSQVISDAAYRGTHVAWRQRNCEPHLIAKRPAAGAMSVFEHADGHDFVSGVGMHVRRLFRFLIRMKRRGIFNRRCHADIAILGGAKELLAGLHDVDGQHDSLHRLQGGNSSLAGQKRGAGGLQRPFCEVSTGGIPPRCPCVMPVYSSVFARA
ncbi:hypothetical protein Bcep18194_C7366 [Burkholderia lata]|uniref:Uncharacterized protein n=1 Tax=Burkholderia lata (strain ATCC 17760 / DSM 23089 / LMG 22485 / NCIMB 9086 / R18194 / 383) TaxID=482957 RepID=Q39MA6_BURL3|nr:hypothetical protein Bcep18194_C7366 [Burkholderia lata]